MAFNPSEWEPLSPNAQEAVDDLVRQRQAARSASANLQQCVPFIRYPQSPADLNNKGAPMATNYSATPPFAHTTNLQRPRTNAGPAFQPSFQSSFQYPHGQGQQQREPTHLPFLDAIPDSFFLPNNEPNTPYQSEQLEPAYIPLPSTTRGLDTTRPQGLPCVAGRPNASSMGSSSPVDATTIAHGATVMMPPPGSGGLRFDSYEAAFATVDPMFRDPITIKDDDVLEVVQNKRKHVKSLVDAMRHTGLMSAADYKNTEQGRNQIVDSQAFDYWQNGASEIVKAHLTMPRVDEKIECAAWEVFEEIVRVHRTGFRFTKETADIKTKCSKRIEDTIVVIKRFALVRQKLLERGNINDLATNPMAFASAIAQYHRNNSKRLVSTGHNRRGAKAEGAIGKAYMSRAEHKNWIKATKAEAKAAGGNGASKANDQQQSHSAAMIASPASGSIPVVEQASILTVNDPGVQRRPTLPVLGARAPLPGPTQAQGYEAAELPRFGIDHFFDFDGDLGSGLAGHSMPRGEFDHGVRDGASFGNFTFGDSPFPHQQLPGSAHHQIRGGGDPVRPSQLGAAYGSYATLADVGATGSSQTYGAAPGAGPNKRRRTDSAAVFEDAWYGTK
jgi:hypothetical protein